VAASEIEDVEIGDISQMLPQKAGETSVEAVDRAAHLLSIGRSCRVPQAEIVCTGRHTISLSTLVSRVNGNARCRLVGPFTG
jgi:hypothetical protein